MIKEYQLRVLPEIAFNEQSLEEYINKEKGDKNINAIRILKRSIDARQRTIYINLKINVYINELPEDNQFSSIDYLPVKGDKQAIVIGAGPAGLFAALRLIEEGIKPIIIERGKDVRSRKKDIANISRDHKVDPNSNYSFGEGGAGAYSDGKLYTRSKKRGNTLKILNIFCQHGASESILIDAHPHIGTDKLPGVIENIRETIIACGGEVHFETRMTEILKKENKAIGVRTDKETEFYGPVILATGHSARDVYRNLEESGIYIEAKGIAIGVRLEHPSELIDKIQYHNREGRGKYLPAAEYNFVQQVENRGVYSFCMCPGGVIVPAATGEKQVVVNGMSASTRSGKFSNSGMVVEIRPEDVNSEFEQDKLCMLRYQEELEKNAWLQGGMKQSAPAQRMSDFVNNRLSSEIPKTTYSPGVIASPLHFWMPEFVTSRLKEGFKAFGRRSHGFLTNEATMIGVETRTSSPVRISRDRETLEHIQITNLFPCGEGAGYAGGIVSAAIDGERCAESLAKLWK